jgi:hypothetical protein
MAAQVQQPPWTGLQITTGFFPLSFFLYLCTPTIVIDGVACQRPWGTHSFELAPGMHNVKIFFKYLIMDTCGANAINVVIQPNCVHRITYEMPPWMFSQGSIRELPPYVYDRS